MHIVKNGGNITYFTSLATPPKYYDSKKLINYITTMS
jgi:hypothetical protein